MHTMSKIHTDCQEQDNLELISEKDSLLEELEKKFDEKTFMCTINHIRDFLMGDRPIEKINSRLDEKKRVFRKLACIDLKELKVIHDYYGPIKRLESYALAIENFKRNQVMKTTKDFDRDVLQQIDKFTFVYKGILKNRNRNGITQREIDVRSALIDNVIHQLDALNTKLIEFEVTQNEVSR